LLVDGGFGSGGGVQRVHKILSAHGVASRRRLRASLLMGALPLMALSPGSGRARNTGGMKSRSTACRFRLPAGWCTLCSTSLAVILQR
jgi:hypothetical protein